MDAIELNDYSESCMSTTLRPHSQAKDCNIEVL